MKTDKNYSSVLFNQIEKIEKNRIRKEAAIVARSLEVADERYAEAAKAMRRAEKTRKKMKRALKKFKKTGDISHLSVFGVE